MDQVRKYNPPPNPAKITDSRFAEYLRNFGEESWELDALEPKILTELIKYHVYEYRDPDKWDEVEKWQAEGKEKLLKMAAKI